MKDPVFQEVLVLLQEAQRESARDAQDRAEELVDRAVGKLQQGLADERLTSGERLELLSRILAAVPPIAQLINTVLQKLM